MHILFLLKSMHEMPRFEAQPQPDDKQKKSSKLGKLGRSAMLAASLVAGACSSVTTGATEKHGSDVLKASPQQTVEPAKEKETQEMRSLHSYIADRNVEIKFWQGQGDANSVANASKAREIAIKRYEELKAAQEAAK